MEEVGDISMAPKKMVKKTKKSKIALGSYKPLTATDAKLLDGLVTEPTGAGAYIHTKADSDAELPKSLNFNSMTLEAVETKLDGTFTFVYVDGEGNRYKVDGNPLNLNHVDDIGKVTEIDHSDALGTYGSSTGKVWQDYYKAESEVSITVTPSLKKEKGRRLL